jgi:hypothetical protein
MSLRLDPDRIDRLRNSCFPNRPHEVKTPIEIFGISLCGRGLHPHVGPRFSRDKQAIAISYARVSEIKQGTFAARIHSDQDLLTVLPLDHRSD